MRVSHLSLSDFRNHNHSEVDFSTGLNVFVGLNGQGKTNLVEAINYFSGLQSHRTNSDTALVRVGAPCAVARMEVEINNRSALLELQINLKGSNRAQINKGKVQPKELSRWFTSVIFSPEDLALVRGEPSVRRKFLDNTYSLVYPGHRAVINDYERVLKQRNTLLKSKRTDTHSIAFHSLLDSWDEQLVELGSLILFARRATVELLTKPLAEQYNFLAEANNDPTIELIESSRKKSANVSRETSPDPADHFNVSRETLKNSLAEAVLSSRKDDIFRGMTLVGPHRDDVVFKLNQLQVKSHASHGETWSYALSLKLAQALVLKEFSPAGDPVIILDDVFAELDASRREKLLHLTMGYEQIIVTSAVIQDIPGIEHWDVKEVRNGTVHLSDKQLIDLPELNGDENSNNEQNIE